MRGGWGPACTACLHSLQAHQALSLADPYGIQRDHAGHVCGTQCPKGLCTWMNMSNCAALEQPPAISMTCQIMAVHQHQNVLTEPRSDDHEKQWPLTGHAPMFPMTLSWHGAIGAGFHACARPQLLQHCVQQWWLHHSSSLKCSSTLMHQPYVGPKPQ